MFSQSVSYTQFRKMMKFYFDQIVSSSEPLLIKRRNGKSLVVMDIDFYESLDETSYLNSSRTNQERLRKALKNTEGDSITFQSIKELKHAIGL